MCGIIFFRTFAPIMRLTYFEAITKIGNKELIFITKILTTMNKKLFYSAPASKVYSIRLEGVIASSDDNTENPIHDDPDDI